MPSTKKETTSKEFLIDLKRFITNAQYQITNNKLLIVSNLCNRKLELSYDK
jgi:hypothetical protein